MNENMIITIKEEVNSEYIQQLHALYPDDILRFLAEDCFIERLSEFVINRFQPKRVTLLSSATDQYFINNKQNKFTPKELVDHLINVCHLPKSVETIDLIGITADFVKNGKNFAEEFARHLALLGYGNIEVKALTNLSDDDLDEVSVKLNPSENQYQVIGYKNKQENSAQMEEVNASLSRIDDNIEFLKHEIYKLKCSLNLLKNNSNESKSQPEEYKNQIDDLQNELKKNKQEREQLIQQKMVLFNVVELLSTHDIRKTLDKTVKFYFNGKIIMQQDDLSQKIERQLEHPHDKNASELIELQINRKFVNKKPEFILMLNSHISDIQSSMRGFTLFSNSTFKIEKIKDLKALKDALIESDDLEKCIILINEKLKDDKLVKGTTKQVTKEILHEMLNQMNEIKESMGEGRDEKRQEEIRL